MLHWQRFRQFDNSDELRHTRVIECRSVTPFKRVLSMSIKTLNLALALVMIGVGTLTLRLVPMTQRTQAEVRRLEAMYGQAFVADPNKFYVRAIDSGKPFQFMWRVHIPNAPRIYFENRSWSGSTGSDLPLNKHGDTIFTCTLRQGKSGIEVNTNFCGTYSGSFDTTRAEDGVLANRDQLQVTLAGDGRVQEYSGDQIVELLRIVPSPTLIAEMDAKYGNAATDQFSIGPLSIRFGFPAAFAKERTAQERHAKEALNNGR